MARRGICRWLKLINNIFRVAIKLHLGSPEGKTCVISSCGSVCGWETGEGSGPCHYASYWLARHCVGEAPRCLVERRFCLPPNQEIIIQLLRLPN